MQSSISIEKDWLGLKRQMRDYIGVSQRVIREKTNKWLGKKRQNELRSKSFTIISNNCWAASVYRYYSLPYQTPTVGLYFFAEEYVRFVQRLKHYLLESELSCKPAQESRYYKILAERNETDRPIGVLDDIELVFLHYPSPKEAIEKWKRRTERVNWNNLFLKFSQMNCCTEECLREFDQIAFENKFVFTARPYTNLESGIYYPGFEAEGQIALDTDRFDRGINITTWLNSEPVEYTLG